MIDDNEYVWLFGFYTNNSNGIKYIDYTNIRNANSNILSGYFWTIFNSTTSTDLESAFIINNGNECITSIGTVQYKITKCCSTDYTTSVDINDMMYLYQYPVGKTTKRRPVIRIRWG